MVLDVTFTIDRWRKDWCKKAQIGIQVLVRMYRWFLEDVYHYWSIGSLSFVMIYVCMWFCEYIYTAPFFELIFFFRFGATIFFYFYFFFLFLRIIFLLSFFVFIIFFFSKCLSVLINMVYVNETIMIWYFQTHHDTIFTTFPNVSQLLNITFNDSIVFINVSLIVYKGANKHKYQ